MKNTTFNFSFISIILCFILRYYGGNAVEINLLAYSVDSSSSSLQTAFDEFARYSEEHNLGVTINPEIMKFDNPTDSYENFKSIVESSLKKSNSGKSVTGKKYDVYFYSSKYLDLFGPYLLNLYDAIDKERIDIFDSKFIQDTCINNGELVGLPVFGSYEVLFSNTGLLNKYKGSIPKTWDQLIDTCKYILKQENDPELICYNGLFTENEQGLNSIYDFIYSCRDSYDSPYPKTEDQTFVDSLKLMKKLKEEVASDTIFTSTEDFTFSKLLTGKALFIKYFILTEPFLSTLPYNVTFLPGRKEGISATSTMGNNVGIIKNISEEKREAAIKVVNYFSSYEYQRNLYDTGISISPLNEIWNNENVCKKGLCNIGKNMQIIMEPDFIKKEGNKLRKKYKSYIYEFLFGNKTAEETQKRIIDVTKVYEVSFDTTESSSGLFYLIIAFVLTVIMLLSLIFLCKASFNNLFKFLPNDFWIITVVGSIVLLWTPLVNLGEITKAKCHLKIVLLCIGFTLSVNPTLYKLISLFPKNYPITLWISKNKYSFLICNILLDLLLNCTTLIKSFTPDPVFVEDGENFTKCSYQGDFSIIFLFTYKLLVILLILFLTFSERSFSDTLIDLKFVGATMFIDILSFILIYVFHIINIKDYDVSFILQTAVMGIVSISNYIFLYSCRIIMKLFIKENEDKIERISSTSCYKGGIVATKSYSNRGSTQVSRSQDSNINNNNNTAVSSMC